MNSNLYATAESSAIPQNELEARALIRTASRLNNIKESWPVDRETLQDALDLNRKLWTIFVTDVSDAESKLPLEIKQNIFNLGHFVFKHTFSILAKPDPAALDILININMNIARGLNEQSARRLQEAEQKQEAEQNSPVPVSNDETA